MLRWGQTAMVYFGARVVTDYLVMATEPIRRYNVS